MADSSKVRLLIIEDDMSECDILNHFFSQDSDIQLCCIANNGIDGIIKAGTLRPDVVLTDFIMPGIDGFGVIKNIRDVLSCNETKILMYSAVSSNIVASKAFAAGADYYIMKPVSLPFLKESIINISKKSGNIDSFQDTCKIRERVQLMGVPVNVVGYDYIVKALEQMIRREGATILKEIYNLIADDSSTSSYCVEMSIRNAIKKADKNKEASYLKIFKNKHPSNSVFLKTLKEIILMNVG